MTPSEWLQADAADRSARVHRAADVTKVLAVLVVATAAVPVAAALASPDASGARRLAAGLLAGAAALGLLVVLMDRRVAVDVPAVVERARLYRWDDAQVAGELGVLRQAALDVNESVVTAAAWVLGAEVLVALAAGVAAAVSLL